MAAQASLPIRKFYPEPGSHLSWWRTWTRSHHRPCPTCPVCRPRIVPRLAQCQLLGAAPHQTSPDLLSMVCRWGDHTPRLQEPSSTPSTLRYHHQCNIKSTSWRQWDVVKDCKSWGNDGDSYLQSTLVNIIHGRPPAILIWNGKFTWPPCVLLWHPPHSGLNLPTVPWTLTRHAPAAPVFTSPHWPVPVLIATHSFTQDKANLHCPVLMKGRWGGSSGPEVSSWSSLSPFTAPQLCINITTTSLFPTSSHEKSK